MATDKQIAANRANTLKHGFSAETMVFPGQDLAEDELPKISILQKEANLNTTVVPGEYPARGALPKTPISQKEANSGITCIEPTG